MRNFISIFISIFAQRFAKTMPGSLHSFTNRSIQKKPPTPCGAKKNPETIAVSGFPAVVRREGFEPPKKSLHPL